ncbi:MAG: hypothetical protein K2O42_03090, partial [Oscillospiraceae bacterium]|nr:hypothetical protein [Oscillospiraceae bacterium]
ELEKLQIIAETQSEEMQKQKKVISSLEKQMEEVQQKNQEQINKLTAELEQAEADKEKIERQLTDSTESYRKLMRTIYQCPSMEKYLSDKGLPETYSESIDAVITFVAVAGANYNFAWDMVNYMIRYKYTNREPMTENEKQMMDVANRFYQEKFQQPDEDVLVIPAGLEKISDCSVMFKKQEMQDIEKATGSFRNATTLYVPAMREYQSKIFKAKAIVAGK